MMTWRPTSIGIFTVWSATLATVVLASGCGRGLTYRGSTSAPDSTPRLLSGAWFDMSSLIGYWPFEEVSLQNGDSVLNLTVHPLAGTFLTDNPGVEKSVKGRVGRAMETDGTGDKVVVGHTSILNWVGGQEISIMFWVKPTLANADQTFLCKGTATGNNYSISNGSSGYESRLVFSYFDGAAWHTFRTDDGPLNFEWTHVAVTFRMPNSTTEYPVIYANGVAMPGSYVASSPPLPPPQTNAGPLTMSACDAAEFFSGRLDDVSLWNRILTPGEVALAHLYQSASP